MTWSTFRHVQFECWSIRELPNTLTCYFSLSDSERAAPLRIEEVICDVQQTCCEPKVDPHPFPPSENSTSHGVLVQHQVHKRLFCKTLVCPNGCHSYSLVELRLLVSIFTGSPCTYDSPKVQSNIMSACQFCIICNMKFLLALDVYLKRIELKTDQFCHETNNE